MDRPSQTSQRRVHVAVLLIATGKYHVFVEPLIGSLKKHFLPGHDVRYILWSDRKMEADICLHHPHEPWPGPTLNRYKKFLSMRPLLEEFDYLYYMDVDMRAVGTIGDEILGDRVNVLHPYFVGKRGTPETRIKSTAYISPRQPMRYFAGGFQGGSSACFLSMAESIHERIEIDKQNEITAVWHDESHLNRYLVSHPPTVVLSPSYCYPESQSMPYEKRLLALDKDHAKMRCM